MAQCVYSLESVYIDSHEPEQLIRSLWSAGYTGLKVGTAYAVAVILVLFIIIGA